MELMKRKRKPKKNKNNNIRELTNKERFLITLLAIVILFWISFNYIIDPQILKISTLDTEIENYSLMIEENNRMIKNRDAIVEERDNLSFEKTNIEKDFFKSLSQPEIIYILNELLLGSDIDMKSITFTKPLIETLNEKVVKKMDVAIPFKGDFEGLTEIIEEIEKEPRKLVINSINVEKDMETEIVGNINLGIYSLGGLVDVDNDDITIKTIDDNKSNPFIPFEGYIDPNEKEEDIPENKEKDKIVKDEYDVYKAVKGDNVSYISKRIYGTEGYVDKILKINGMQRSSVLPIGKELKLIKK